MRSAAACGSDGGADAGAINQRVELAKFRVGESERPFNAFLAGDISQEKARIFAQFGGKRSSLFLVAVNNDDTRAAFYKSPCRTRAETGSATGDDRGGISHFHGKASKRQH